MGKKTFKTIRFVSKLPGVFQKIVYYILQDKINYKAYYQNLKGKEGLRNGGPQSKYLKKMAIYPFILCLKVWMDVTLVKTQYGRVK